MRGSERFDSCFGVNFGVIYVFLDESVLRVPVFLDDFCSVDDRGIERS